MENITCSAKPPQPVVPDTIVPRAKAWSKSSLGYEEIEDGAGIMQAERARKLASIRKSARGRGAFPQ